jgi:hypothetical protein
VRTLIQSALLLIATSIASAQVSAFAQTSGSPFRGSPASVTSIGFMHNPPTAASITSIRPSWSSFNLRPGGTFGTIHLGKVRDGKNRFGPTLFPSYNYPYYAPIYPSYYPVVTPQDEIEAEAARELRKGPAVDQDDEADLDRLADRIARKLKNSDRNRDTEARELAPEPAPQAVQPEIAFEQHPATLLIFRDGRQEEIYNFAIMGDSLYVLSDKRQKIALAELDVEKTIQANDERGITIRLPKKG